MLQVEDLRAGYDGSQVLFGISLDVREGEAVTLLGRNGMGKTTTISAVMGLVRPSGGSVRIAGARFDGAPPHRVARAGLGLVPEGRQVFPTLTVEENLVATAANRAGGAPRWTLKRVYELFPKLEQRRENLGNQLSGGEQQMLAIGRALMTNPRLLVLDEATEGLAPLVRREIWQRLEALKADGQAILIVDKNVDQLARFADRHVIIEKGEVVWTGDTEALLAQPELKDRFLHV
ncbi:ABC transporter ATP-binding protein [Faunimonas sp. B44]|uniref:ABC transporter ATP-binding protein n=1 Tax=Faunimonas sp. B44 TaxID=3461493 RepID=UPI004043DED2